MPSSKDEIDTEYTKGKATTVSIHKTPTETEKIDVEKYGDGKPRRVTIRARIIHGNKDKNK